VPRVLKGVLTAATI